MSINDRRHPQNANGLNAAGIKELRRQVAEHYTCLQTKYVEMLHADEANFQACKENIVVYLEILVTLANDEKQQIRPYIAAFISTGKGWTKLVEKIEAVCLAKESETYVDDFAKLEEYLGAMKKDFIAKQEMYNLDISLELHEKQNEENTMENKDKTVTDGQASLDAAKENYSKKLEELDTKTDEKVEALVGDKDKPVHPSDLSLTEKIVVGALAAVTVVGVVYLGVQLLSGLFGDDEGKDVIIYDEN